MCVYCYCPYCCVFAELYNVYAAVTCSYRPLRCIGCYMYFYTESFINMMLLPIIATLLQGVECMAAALNDMLMLK